MKKLLTVLFLCSFLLVMLNPYNSLATTSPDDEMGGPGGECALNGYKRISWVLVGGDYAMLCNCDSYKGNPKEECVTQ